MKKVILTLFFLLSFFFFYSQIAVETVVYDIPGSSGITLVFISDLHLKEIGYKEKEVLKIIGNLAPDILVLGGDAVDKAGKELLLDAFLKALPGISYKYAIYGNWEHWADVSPGSIYESNGFDFLVNSRKNIRLKGKNITLTAIDDIVGGTPDRGLLTLPEKSDFSILLSHCPVVFGEPLKNIDLVLSGHSHGGQVNLLGVTPFLPRGVGPYVSGLYRSGETFLVVSKGVGTSIIPFRFGALSEVTVIRL